MKIRCRIMGKQAVGGERERLAPEPQVPGVFETGFAYVLSTKWHATCFCQSFSGLSIQCELASLDS